MPEQGDPLVITLDGPSGVGKTTLAKEVAGALDLPYLDSGAMFRALALLVHQKGEKPDPARAAEYLRGMRFSLTGRGRTSALMVNGQPLGDDIRTEAIGALASELGTYPEVRAILKQKQKELGQRGALVAEGRDMGSVVFPRATYKFFLEAAPHERARRRVNQLRGMGRPADFEDICRQMRLRDEKDECRAIAPLRPAEDAIIIQTGDLSLEQARAAILSHIIMN